MRQKDASETEGESIQNSDQASNAIRGETWATTKRQEQRIEVTEMRMLRWMCGVTRKDKIRNEHIRGTTSVAQASKKMTERRLIWYGHVMRRDGEHIGPTEHWRIQRWSQGGFQVTHLKPGTHHAIFVVCWTQRRRKDDCCMVCAHQRQLSPVDFTNATVVGPIRKTNRSNNCCMVCAGQRHLSHQPTGHRPITVKHFRDA